MSIETQIETLLTPPLEELGIGIVRITMHGAQRKVVEIMIEKLDESPVKVEDCVRASKESATFLEVEDLIKGAYVLEVTSPGLDRPLTKPKDYKRYIGSQIKVETYAMRDNQRKFTGTLEEADDEGFKLLIEENGQSQTALFNYSDVRKTKLVPDLDF